MTLVARARRSIAERGLIAPGTRVLIACSGGPDSAAMLGVLAALAPELGLSLEVASVDHGLRAEAAQDVELARAQAAGLGVAFHALRVDVGSGASIQARARTARYAALLQLAAARGAQRIATGHTLDDQAETVLLRLLRGAGVRGLSAIEPLRADGVVRPLIDCARSDVHAFARDSFQDIARDSSNHDPRFERVRVRSSLLPALRAHDVAIEAHLVQLADEARELSLFVDEAAEKLLCSARLGPETLSISVLREAPPALRVAALRAWLLPQTGPLARAHLLQLLETCVLGRGEVWLSAQHCVVAEPGEALRLRLRTPHA